MPDIQETDGFSQHQQTWLEQQQGWVDRQGSTLAQQEAWLEQRRGGLEQQQGWIEQRGGWLTQQGEKLTQQEAWLCQQEEWLDQRGVSLVQQYSELVHQHQWMKQRRRWLDHQLRQLIQQESALIQGGESGERLSGQMYPIKLCLSSPHIFCGQSQQVLHLERFREKIIGTSFPGHLSRVFMGREHDDRKTMRGFLAFELPANRSPIRAGEPDIQEQQIRERLGHLLHGVSIPVLATCAVSRTMRSLTQSARI